MRPCPAHHPIRFAAALALPLLAWAPCAASAQGSPQGGPGAVRSFPIDVESAPRPEARVTRTSARITIDGIPDEAAWSGAEPITDFVQSMPQTGMPASEKTVVRVMYDAERIYISVVCYDSDMSSLIVPSLEQDFETHDSDVLGIVLDTYMDRRNAFMFLINPGGAIKDVQAFDNSRNLNIPWEGVLDYGVAVLDSAWTVEVAIPFTTLRFAEVPGEQSWGANFSRRIRRKNEDAFWSPLARRELLHKMSRAGTLHGLQDLRGGRNISVKPYFTASDASESLTTSGAGDSGFDGGFDVKWGVTPRMTADATFHTDFSQVEVDQERVNLTRFSLFFPEKRDFFLENAGTFTFGDVTERNVRMGSSLSDFTLFHSRRIGLDAGGLPIPILGGSRLTGQAGAWNVGLLEMQTRSARGSAAENFAVARVRRNVLGESDVGAVFVNRQATDGSGTFNRSYGVDANLHFMGRLLINTYLAGTAQSEAATGDAWAGRMAVAWRDKLWDVSTFVKQVGEAFDPGVGFVRRTGVRQTYATVGAHPVPTLPKIQEMNPYGEVSYITDPSGLLLNRDATAGLSIAFGDGGSFATSYTDRFERLDQEFKVRTGVVVPTGDYGFHESTVSYKSSAGRPFSASASLTTGGYYDGDRTSVGLGALWRPSRHLGFDLFVDRNDITLPDASFTADVYGGRINWALSTRFFTTAFVQYNAETDEVFSNVRVNFIHAPLSDIFLVYTERRSAGSGTVIDRLLSFKITQLVGF
ncbi:MAG: carbohydrate binding family 9 domain-containing protein [Longimicrobiales bacterium]